MSLEKNYGYQDGEAPSISPFDEEVADKYFAHSRQIPIGDGYIELPPSNNLNALSEVLDISQRNGEQ